MQRVSIIVPVYNVEHYLDRCIDSLVHQSYNNIEILLINDGSTDLSGSICKKYGGYSNVAVIEQEIQQQEIRDWKGQLGTTSCLSIQMTGVN